MSLGLLPLAQLIDGDLGVRAQIIAAVGTVLLLALVLELVRRRRLIERYALLWILAAVVLVVLAVWNDALGLIADGIGILSPPNALFFLGLAAAFGLLLHFSVVISRLGEETKILAQTVSRLDAELRELRGEGPRRNGNGESSAHEEPDRAPVEAQEGRERG